MTPADDLERHVGRILKQITNVDSAPFYGGGGNEVVMALESKVSQGIPFLGFRCSGESSDMKDTYGELEFLTLSLDVLVCVNILQEKALPNTGRTIYKLCYDVRRYITENPVSIVGNPTRVIRFQSRTVLLRTNSVEVHNLKFIVEGIVDESY